MLFITVFCLTSLHLHWLTQAYSQNNVNIHSLDDFLKIAHAKTIDPAHVLVSWSKTRIT